jgi:hypothetical protein
MSTIGERIPIVASLLGGRTDLNNLISLWLLNGYRDLASTIPFETLESTEDNLTAPNQPTLDYPGDARAIKALTLSVPSSGPTSQRPLYKRNMAILDRYAVQPTGIPSIWAPFQNQIHLRQVPDKSYPVVVRYWRKVSFDPARVDDTVLEVPDDWLEIVDYAAQLRGYMDLQEFDKSNMQEFDKSNMIRTLLYGNPRQPGRLGLIRQRLTRIQAESENASYGLRPRLHRYTFVP